MAKKKTYRIKPEFMGQEVSYWVAGYPRTELLSDKTSPQMIKRLLAYRHPAIEQVQITEE